MIIADGFYEWKKVNGKKFPHRIMLESGDLFAFAGLWDLWEGNGNTLLSCSIITTSPNKLCAKIHDRMPVILPKNRERDWLTDMPIEQVIKMLQPCADDMKC